MRDPLYSEIYENGMQFFTAFYNGLDPSLTAWRTLRQKLDFIEDKTRFYLLQILSTTEGKWKTGDYAVTWDGNYEQVANMVAEDVRIHFERNNRGILVSEFFSIPFRYVAPHLEVALGVVMVFMAFVTYSRYSPEPAAIWLRHLFGG